MISYVVFYVTIAKMIACEFVQTSILNGTFCLFFTNNVERLVRKLSVGIRFSSCIWTHSWRPRSQSLAKPFKKQTSIIKTFIFIFANIIIFRYLLYSFKIDSNNANLSIFSRSLVTSRRSLKPSSLFIVLKNCAVWLIKFIFSWRPGVCNNKYKFKCHASFSICFSLN